MTEHAETYLGSIGVICKSPDGNATAVCAQRAKGVGSLSFQVKLLQSSIQASHNTCNSKAVLLSYDMKTVLKPKHKADACLAGSAVIALSSLLYRKSDTVAQRQLVEWCLLPSMRVC